MKPALVELSVTNLSSLRLGLRIDLTLRLRVRRKTSGIDRAAIDGEVQFNSLVVAADESLGIDPLTGRTHATLQELNLDWSNATLQFPGLEAEFHDPLFSLVRDSLIPILWNELAGGPPELYAVLLSGADITLPEAGFPVSRLNGTGDVAVALGARWSVALMANGLTLGAGLRVTNPEPDPTGRIPLPSAPTSGALGPGCTPEPRSPQGSSCSTNP